MKNIVVMSVIHLPLEEVFEAVTRIGEWRHLFQSTIGDIQEGSNADTMKVKLCLTGRVRQFEAKLVRYDENSHIGWRSTRGLYVAGEIIFERLDTGWTHMIVALHYNVEGFSERALSFTNIVLGRLDAAVERLKLHLESLPSPALSPAEV